MEDGLRGDAMEFLGTLTILIALAYTPWMMAKRRGIPMPPPPHVLVWYVLRVALFVFDFVISSGATSRRFPPFSASDVSSISVELEGGDDLPDQQTDNRQTSLSALECVIDQLQVDRSRRVIIDTLLLSGWKVGEIRGILKGDNNTISLEVEAARKRLGIETADRKLLVRDNGHPAREIAF
jgi:hypothetical protein